MAFALTISKPIHILNTFRWSPRALSIMCSVKAFALNILKPIHILNTNQPKRKLAYRSRPCFYRLELELELHITEHLSDVTAAKKHQKKNLFYE